VDETQELGNQNGYTVHGDGTQGGGPGVKERSFCANAHDSHNARTQGGGPGCLLFAGTQGGGPAFVGTRDAGRGPAVVVWVSCHLLLPLCCGVLVFRDVLCV